LGYAVLVKRYALLTLPLSYLGVVVKPALSQHWADPLIIVSPMSSGQGAATFKIEFPGFAKISVLVYKGLEFFVFIT
jgi:hypothetical protein